MEIKTLGSIQKLIILTVALLAILPLPVHGYIDPGSGSYFVQLIIGFLLGGLFTIKLFFSKIKNFFREKFFRKK
ncbi:hypothetical protein AMJ48_01900 [Parcubacteria bacterium DG_74_1]|nr:MAG: hypothetical protein AMJ48_01900 [Parcubacteria bacterium DG_74_1]